MAVPKQLLELIVCPVTRRPLFEADDALKSEIMGKLRSGEIKPAQGADWSIDEVTGFLVTDDRKLAYPVIADIPDLLPMSAVRLAE